jgi:hypothetical protein
MHKLWKYVLNNCYNTIYFLEPWVYECTKPQFCNMICMVVKRGILL